MRKTETEDVGRGRRRTRGRGVHTSPACGLSGREPGREREQCDSKHRQRPPRRAEGPALRARLALAHKSGVGHRWSCGLRGARGDRRGRRRAPPTRTGDHGAGGREGPPRRGAGRDPLSLTQPDFPQGGHISRPERRVDLQARPDRNAGPVGRIAEQTTRDAASESQRNRHLRLRDVDARHGRRVKQVRNQRAVFHFSRS